MKKLTILIAIALGIAVGIVANAQILQPKPNSWVHDYAGALSEKDVASLNKLIQDNINKKHSQLAIVLINELPESETIETYANKIGREWHVGNYNNGLVYVAVIKAHKQRLEVADHLQGGITDVDALRIIEENKPFLKYGDYDGAMSTMVVNIAQKIDAYEQAKYAKPESDFNLFTEWWFYFGLFLTTIGAYLFYRKSKADKEYHKALIAKANTPYTRKYPTVKHFIDNELNKPKNKSVITPPKKNNDFAKGVATGIVADEIIRPRQSSYEPPSSSSSYDTGSSHSSGSNSSSDYGSYGSSSDSSSSSDSGFSGGGASSDW